MDLYEYKKNLTREGEVFLDKNELIAMLLESADQVLCNHLS